MPLSQDLSPPSCPPPHLATGLTGFLVICIDVSSTHEVGQRQVLVCCKAKQLHPLLVEVAGLYENCVLVLDMWQR